MTTSKPESGPAPGGSPPTHPARQYCLFMNGRKYNRNIGCKRHDNAYGINGGGSEADRRRADRALYAHMRAHRDPLAPLVLAAITCFGWFFFNYHGRPWRGQLVRRFVRKG